MMSVVARVITLGYITLSLPCGEQKRHNRRVKHWETTLAVLAALSASLALADDFKTISGKEYKNVTVSRVEADGIVLKSKSGISKVYFVELPKDVQQRFNYDPTKAAAYSAEQIAALQALQKQQEEATQPKSQSGSQQLQQKPSTEQLHRVGAICRDGSESGAIGRGARSHHGGVRCWKYSDCTCH